MAVKTPAPVWKDFVSGSLGADINAATAGTTQTMTSPGLAKLPAITLGTQIATIVLDPFAVKGTPEIVYVTAHVAGATTASIKRITGQALRTHKNAEQWVHGPTALDFTAFQSQLDDVMQKSLEYTAAGQIVGCTSPGVTKSISIGSQYQSLTVDTSIDTKLTYKYVPFVCTSSTRPASPYEGMHIYETDTDHTLAYKGATDGWCYVDLPPGTIRMTAAGSLEPGEVWCDGTQYNGALTKYAALYAKIGKSFGGGTASLFRVPDLRSKFVYGGDSGSIATTGGAASVTLTNQQVPPHNHTIPAHDHNMAGHSHAGAANEEGGHTHTWGFGFTNFLVTGIVGASHDDGHIGHLNKNFPIGSDYPAVYSVPMNEAGIHGHSTGTIGPTPGNTGQTSLTTNNNTYTGSQQGVSILPPYVTLGYAIRL